MRPSTLELGRKRLKLTQTDLESITGVHQSVISLYESGKREMSSRDATSLAHALGGRITAKALLADNRRTIAEAEASRALKSVVEEVGRLTIAMKSAGAESDLTTEEAVEVAELVHSIKAAIPNLPTEQQAAVAAVLDSMAIPEPQPDPMADLVDTVHRLEATVTGKGHRDSLGRRRYG